MNKKTLYWGIGGVVTLALIVLLAISIASEGSVDEAIGYGEVSVSGDLLPAYRDPANDPAVSTTAPSVSGADWNGTPVEITADGTPKIVIFLAHWCSHCQAEVPLVQRWVNEGNLPDDVELISIATSTTRSRPNWPPQDWLERENWTAPVIMDDAIGTAAASYGMSGTPFYVVLDGQNNVLQRASGEIGVAGLTALAAIAASSVG